MEKNCINCKYSELIGTVFYQCKLTKSMCAVWSECNNWEEKEDNEN